MRASIETGNVRLGGLQASIDRLNNEVAALGAVNLAALDELASARERKQFLDAQSADLTEAMSTLEDAIRKIDAASSSMPATSSSSMIIASIRWLSCVTPSMGLAIASKAPSVEPACAKMPAQAMISITTAEISAESTSTR